MLHPTEVTVHGAVSPAAAVSAAAAVEAASVVLVEGCQVAVVPEAAGNRPFNTIDNFTLQTHTQTKIV